jgi:dienelactone hydrolase
MWNREELYNAPQTYPAAGFEEYGVQALYYDSVPWAGKPTRVFAWLGLPEVVPGSQAPGIVLVHGGGGTAFAHWVRLWTSRGYAAIAMDTCGCVPVGSYSNWQRHEQGGPPGWGGFDQMDQAPEDQWSYHAIAASLLGHSLLRSLPEVDETRIGVTGISWGGYLTSLLSGVDDRFAFAAPVYGCGHYEDTVFAEGFAQAGEEALAHWLGLWDPSVTLPNMARPMLWVNGTNDFAYWMDAWQKSYRLPSGPHTLCLRPRMPHGHTEGENPTEIHAFAESLVREGEPLVRVLDQGRERRRVWTHFDPQTPVVRAELNFTRDLGRWPDRTWEDLPATLDPQGTVTADLPEGTTVYYFNLFDDRDLIVSTEHVTPTSA